MSKKYDDYIKQHQANVAKGFQWFRDNLPEFLIGPEDYEWMICMNHDVSKNNPFEYEAYDAYFYGSQRSFEVVEDFNKAWLGHIHQNPHHWQYWVLINDDPNEGMILIDMPDHYILEMICDWWSFSWAKGNLNEIFSWYEERKDYMRLSQMTRKKVENILIKMREKI